jgi:predicted GNAT superfamily acetyltransferase
MIELMTKASVLKTQTIQFKDIKTYFSYGYNVVDYNSALLPAPIGIYKNPSSSAFP